MYKRQRLTPDRLEPDIREAMRLTRSAVEEISRLQPEDCLLYTSHPRLNLVTAIGYRKGAAGESAASHEYGYDALMRLSLIHI